MEELFLKSPAQVAISLEMLKRYYSLISAIPLKEVLTLAVVPIKHEIKRGNPISPHWDYDVIFSTIGSAVLTKINELQGLDVPAFAHLLLTKHRQYGAEPLTEWGPIGIVIRIDSKVKRFLNMDNKSDDTDYESVHDTLVDILGYCVLGLNYPYPGRQPPHGQIEERIKYLNNLIELKNTRPFHPLFPYDNSK